MLVADLVCGQHNPWQRLYDPARPYPEGFHQDGDSQSIVDSVDQIGRGEGGVIVRADETLAVWRDDAGKLHAVSATCTHKGCTVTWNNADHTWDCPCHGSIFAADGSVIHGPARKALAPAQV
jgi:Rieske Fe-S protein